MAEISFTSNLRRHVACPDETISAATLHELLHQYFAKHEGVEGYVLDDQSVLRQHMVIFIDGEQAKDRLSFSDALQTNSQVHVFQALSGG
ncbi:MAG: molybdopterin synthase sulfur carrier subunit [Planctomycetota bacterium]|jgi:molybdopterin synthase sulfur carrier subunit